MIVRTVLLLLDHVWEGTVIKRDSPLMIEDTVDKIILGEYSTYSKDDITPYYCRYTVYVWRLSLCKG